MNSPNQPHQSRGEQRCATLNCQLIDTPVGKLRLLSNGAQLLQIDFDGGAADPTEAGSETDPVLERASGQLREYFAGQRRIFDLPLAPQGTDFQQSVWRALAQIPWGEWRSYGDVARAIGRPKAVRAVGAANGRNPLPIVVPCHRVVGSDRSLTGFAGGVEIKRYLLALEGSLDDLKA